MCFFVPMPKGKIKIWIEMKYLIRENYGLVFCLLSNYRHVNMGVFIHFLYKSSLLFICIVFVSDEVQQIHQENPCRLICRLLGWHKWTSTHPWNCLTTVNLNIQNIINISVFFLYCFVLFFRLYLSLYPGAWCAN
jgi:hypothetical protein